MHDVLGNGRKIRILNIIDDYNREALAVESHFNIQSNMVVQSLKDLIAYRGKPQQIRVDNGRGRLVPNLLQMYWLTSVERMK
ncbi:DDE-type integrase/transposase/recombinase [Jiulongibacter sediminis]|uniref:DDE-type integrase/transposase/recombinase n=1 Tax=Jiulongibacter sediminis TaxID=1605367 RepID=UPI0038D491FD